MLKKCIFFSYLTPDQLVLVSKYMDRFDLPKGENLFVEGEKGDFVCFVLDGVLEVLKVETIHGDSNVIATLIQGNSIGEMTLVGHHLRSATVRAMVDCKLAVLTQRAFDTMVDKEPKLGVNVLKGLVMVLSENLRETSLRLIEEMQ